MTEVRRQSSAVGYPLAHLTSFCKTLSTQRLARCLALRLAVNVVNVIKPFGAETLLLGHSEECSPGTVWKWLSFMNTVSTSSVSAGCLGYTACATLGFTSVQPNGKESTLQRNPNVKWTRPSPAYVFVVLQKEPEVLSGKRQFDGRELLHLRAFGNYSTVFIGFIS